MLENPKPDKRELAITPEDGSTDEVEAIRLGQLNYYERLGVQPRDSMETIKKAYEQTKNKFPKETSPKIFMLINEAAAILLDPKFRGRYNREINIYDINFPYTPDEEVQDLKIKESLLYLEEHKDIPPKFLNHQDSARLMNAFKDFIFDKLIEMDFDRVDIMFLHLRKIGHDIKSLSEVLHQALKEFIVIFIKDQIKESEEKVDDHIYSFYELDKINEMLSNMETTFQIKPKNLVYLYESQFQDYLDNVLSKIVKMTEKQALEKTRYIVYKFMQIGFSLDWLDQEFLKHNYTLRDGSSLYDHFFES